VEVLAISKMVEMRHLPVRVVTVVMGEMFRLSLVLVLVMMVFLAGVAQETMVGVVGPRLAGKAAVQIWSKV
jgi:hypothetical protein